MMGLKFSNSNIFARCHNLRKKVTIYPVRSDYVKTHGKIRRFWYFFLEFRTQIKFGQQNKQKNHARVIDFKDQTALTAKFAIDFGQNVANDEDF